MIDRDHLIRVAREEMRKHSFDTVVDGPAASVQSGEGRIVTGCPVCKRKFYSLNQFAEHLLSDVLPIIADRVAAD
jgi:hypothetical protein